MSLSFFNIFLIIISFLAFVISSGFITDCSRRLGNLPEKSTNEDLKNAYKYSVWAAVIGWISVALLLGAGILIVIYSAEIYESGFASYLVTGILFFTMAGAALIGVLSAIVASDINKSGVKDNNNAYRQAIIATVIGIIAFVGVLIAFSIKMFYKPKPKVDQDIAKLQEELKEPNVCSVWQSERACENDGCNWTGVGCEDFKPL